MFDIADLFKHNTSKDICDYIDKYPYLINQVDDHGELPLNVAIMLNNEEVFKYLLLKKADVNIKNNSNVSPLMKAYISKNMNFFDELLLRGADDPNVIALVQKDYNIKYAKVLSDAGRTLPNIMTPLHLAAAKGNLEDVKWLLDITDYSKVNVNDKSYFGMLPLHLAAMYGHNDVVTELIINKSLINAANNKNETPLILAVKFNQLEVVKILLNNNANVIWIDGNRRNALSYASSFNYSCYSEGENIEEKINLNAEIVKLLLDAGADTSDVTKYATIAMPLSKIHIQISIYPSYPIIIAIINGNIRAVELLLDYGVDVNAQDDSGKTILMYAAENDKFEIAKLLVERGANIFVYFQQETMTALWYANINGHEEIVQLLLDKMVQLFLDNNEIGKYLLDVDCGYNSCPAIIATIYGNIRALTVMLDNGVNVNTGDSNRKTLLMYACENGYYDIAKLLIERGADIFISGKQRDDITALWFAKVNHNDDIVQLLEDAGRIRL